MKNFVVQLAILDAPIPIRPIIFLAIWCGLAGGCAGRVKDATAAQGRLGYTVNAQDHRAISATSPHGLSPVMPQHFWFIYLEGLAPGIRVWMRISADVWAELYPDGTESRYRVSRRESVLGRSGTVLKKFSGDLEKTGTLNDGSFEAFIPDFGPGELMIAFRFFDNRQWSSWAPLAPIRVVNP